MEHAMAEGMQLVDKEQFDRVIFGERIADFNWFIELNQDRIGESGEAFPTKRIAIALQLQRNPQGAARSNSKLQQSNPFACRFLIPLNSPPSCIISKS
jgi:hypothetical protein